MQLSTNAAVLLAAGHEVLGEASFALATEGAAPPCSERMESPLGFSVGGSLPKK